MKKIIRSLIFLFCCGSQYLIYGQSTVTIIGVVKSSQGALQGAEVSFHTLNDEFQGNCISGPDGKFASQNRLPTGRTIKIRIRSSGYDLFEKTYQVDNSGNAGEFMMEGRQLTISGFVRDSISESVLQGVEMSFYDESRLIQARSTNSQGYFQIETNFTYGQKITVRASKNGFYEKEQTLTFTSDDRNSLPDILLPQIGDRGLRAFIKVIDKKKLKPLVGANVRYLDRRKSTYIDSIVSKDGKLELKLYQRPGTILDLEISKPNYRTIKAQPTLNEDPRNNVHEYLLERDRRSALGPALLSTTGVAALVGVGMYLSSNSKYDSYKDYGNENRENDYESAQSQRNIAVASAAVAGCAAAAYLIYKIRQKNKEKALERNRVQARVPLASPVHAAKVDDNARIIGLVYKF